MTMTKKEKLMAIKEEFARTQARLVVARKLEESAQPTSMATLLENDLDQAELILAAQDLMHKLQNMAEDLAKMNAQDLFPLVDKMKAAFGPEKAHAFETAGQEVLSQAMNTVRHAKDEMGTAIMQLEGTAPANDMANDVAPAEPAAEPFAEPAAGDLSADLDGAMDDFGAADAAAGPVDEPLGRAKKESVEGGKALNESVILEAAGRKLLETETLDSLIDWVLNEAAMGMPEDHFKSFASSVAKKAAHDPAKLAGWIGKKKHGMAAMAQLAEPTFTQAADLDVVETFTEGKTYKRGEDADQDEDQKEKFKARNAARKQKQKGDDALDEGKTFRKGDEDEDEDKAERFKARNSARKEKQKGDDAVNESALVARTLASLIEGNIKKFGKGMANKTVNEFAAKLASEGGLMEGNEDTTTWVLEAFANEFGASPASYSVSKLREFISMTSTDKKNAGSAMAKIAGKMGANKSAATQSVQSAMAGMDGQERNAANKMLNQMKQDGQAPKNAGEFAQAASGMIDGDDDQVNENINAAHWPVDTHGQYKGEPMSTDYGKLKPLTTPKVGKTEGGEKAAEPKADEVEGSKAPEGGKPWEKKSEPKTEEPKEESTEEKVEEGFGKVLKKAALGAGAAAALASGSAAARTSDPIGNIISTSKSDAPKASSSFDAAFGKGAVAKTGDRFDADAAAAQAAANDVKQALRGSKIKK